MYRLTLIVGKFNTLACMPRVPLLQSILITAEIGSEQQLELLVYYAASPGLVSVSDLKRKRQEGGREGEREREQQLPACAQSLAGLTHCSASRSISNSVTLVKLQQRKEGMCEGVGGEAMMGGHHGGAVSDSSVIGTVTAGISETAACQRLNQLPQVKRLSLFPSFDHTCILVSSTNMSVMQPPILQWSQEFIFYAVGRRMLW